MLSCDAPLEPPRGSHVDGHAGEATALAGMGLRLREIETERDRLRAEVEAQRQLLDAATDRLRTLEQLWQTIRHGRAYDLLRRVGRWRWVDHLLAELPRPDASTRSTLEDADGFPLLVGLSHNIPEALPVGPGHLAVFRIRNVGREPIHLPPQHTLPWAGRVAPQGQRIDVTLDGRLLATPQVDGDCIQPGTCASIFLPLRARREGQHRLQIALVAPGAPANGGERRPLFDIGYRDSATTARLPLRARLRQFAFRVRHVEWPLLMRRLRCQSARAVFRVAGEGPRRSVHLRRWKEQNRRLALIEQQTRTQTVASVPCYLTVETTAQCNLRCPLCFRQYAGAAERLRAAGDMPGGMLDEIIRTLLPTAYTINPSSCGEPLLSPHLDTLLDACRRFEVFLSLVTNGTLLNRRGLLDRLIPVLHRLEISFDSSNPETFERLRAGARFDRVLENARTVGRIRSSLPDPKFSFGFSMTLYRENLGEIPDVLRLVADCGGTFLRTDIGVIFSMSDLPRSLLHCPQTYNDAFVTATQCASELGLTLHMRPPFVEATEVEATEVEATRYGACDYLYTHACIATDGSFRPCFFMGMPAQRLAITQPLVRLWNSPGMRDLRGQHDTERGPEACRRCYMTLQGRDSVSARAQFFVRGEAAV